MDHAEKVGRVTNSIFLNLTVQPTDQMGNVINRGFIGKLYFKTCEKAFQSQNIRDRWPVPRILSQTKC